MMMRRTRVVLALLVAAVTVTGCASTSRRSGLNSRLIRPADSSSSAPAPYDTPATEDSLETVMGKIREISARARPVVKPFTGPTLETYDPTLAAALGALNAWPGAEAHRLVAQQYARLGVFDAAYKHYRAVLALAPSDGGAYDGLARLWRDAGLSALALGDARRAVYFAPQSAEARNTLGTVLQALGYYADARRAYEAALEIRPGAAYALNNLGYLALLDGHTSRAVRYFREAIAEDGSLAAARHNLALAYASARRMDLAREALVEAGPPAQASYNLGILSLAGGQRAEALVAFNEACRLDAAQPHACERARALESRTQER